MHCNCDELELANSIGPYLWFFIFIAAEYLQCSIQCCIQCCNNGATSPAAIVSFWNKSPLRTGRPNEPDAAMAWRLGNGGPLLLKARETRNARRSHALLSLHALSFAHNCGHQDQLHDSPHAAHRPASFGLESESQISSIPLPSFPHSAGANFILCLLVWLDLPSRLVALRGQWSVWLSFASLPA